MIKNNKECHDGCMNKLRTVDVYEQRHGENGFHVATHGIFHQFLSVGANVVAIIETKNGSIITPKARMIKFTSPAKYDEKHRSDPLI